MKKLLTITILAFAAFTMTSCDDDSYINLDKDGNELYEGYSNGEFAFKPFEGAAWLTRCYLDAEKAVIPAKVKIEGVEYPVVGIFAVPGNAYDGFQPQDIFVHNESIKTLVIPDSFKKLERLYLPNLTTIKIGSGVEYISYFAFWPSEKLETVTVDAKNPNYMSKDNVVFTKDGKELVYCPFGKTGSYAIPEGVTTLGTQCIWHNQGLTEVKIPASVTKIDVCSIFGCAKLTDIVNLAKTPQDADGAFHLCTPEGFEKITLHVPSGCKEAYQQAFYWKEFKHIVDDAK